MQRERAAARRRRAARVPRPRPLPLQATRTFTTCEPGRDDWVLQAAPDRPRLRERGRPGATARACASSTCRSSAFPSPAFRSSNRRRSGLLTPYYSQTTQRGFEVGVPVLLEHRAGARRHHHAGIHGQARRAAEEPGALPRARLFGRAAAANTCRRTASSAQRAARHIAAACAHLRPNLTGQLDYNRVSDDRYFVDLASQVRQVSHRQPAAGRLRHLHRQPGQPARTPRRRGCRTSRRCRIRSPLSCRPTTALRSSASAPT